MAITILPEEKGLAGTLGESLGGGLSQILLGLAENKAKKMRQEQTTQGLASLFGSELAQKLAPLDPLLLRELVKGKMKEQSNQAFFNAATQGGFLGPGLSQQFGEQPQDGLSAGALAQEGGLGQPGEQQPQQQMMQPGMSKEDFFRLKQQSLAEEGLGLKKRQVEAAEQKTVRPEVIKITEAARTADRDLDTLSDLDKVLKSGDLRSPQTQSFLEKLDLEGFFPDTKVGLVKKIISQLGMRQLSGLPSGGRPTAALWDKIETGLPSLLLTKEGNLLISESLKLGAKERKLLSKEVRSLRNKNNGLYPPDVIEQASENIQPKIQKLIAKKNEQIDSILGLGKKEFNVGSVLDQLPPASSIPKEKRDALGVQSPDGSIYKSDGTNWKKVR
jgi:hypothetical protein